MSTHHLLSPYSLLALSCFSHTLTVIYYHIHFILEVSKAMGT